MSGGKSTAGSAPARETFITPRLTCEYSGLLSSHPCIVTPSKVGMYMSSYDIPCSNGLRYPAKDGGRERRIAQTNTHINILRTRSRTQM